MKGNAGSHPSFMIRPEFMKHPSLCVLCASVVNPVR